MNFREEAERLETYIVEKRRWIHSHAELSFEEKETTAYIAGELKNMGLEILTFPDYYGVIGVLRGRKTDAGRPATGGPPEDTGSGAHAPNTPGADRAEGAANSVCRGGTVMLRADIDALPLTEAGDLPFASCHPGAMHACGHDCHSAMLLGAARLLCAHREELCGTVKFLFQSAEESCHGANYYVDHGCLGGVDAIFGLHVWDTMPTGMFNIEAGFRMASCDNFTIVVEGSSAHGSTPHLGKDAIVAACSVIMNLQTFVSRENDPLNPMVVTVGTVRAGTQFNIIADRAVMEGTIRTYGPEMRKKVQEELGRIVTHTAQALGCTAQFINTPVIDPVVNDRPKLNEIAVKAAEKLYGSGCLRKMQRLMGSEDMAVLMRAVPGVMAYIGYYNEELHSVYPVHSDHFRVDEALLARGTALYAQFAFDYLEKMKEAGDR